MTAYPLLRAGILLALVFTGACQAPDLPESSTDIHSGSTEADWSAFTLGPGDLVHLSVFGQPDFSSPSQGVRVGPDGKLVIPLLGSVDVSGLTASEASLRIEEALREYLLEPSVSLSVLEHASKRFFIFGEVNNPGPYPMERPYSALEAFAMGGGPIVGARLDPVLILRKQGKDDVEVIPFNVKTPGPDGLVQLLPDDMIFVPRSGSGVFRETILPYLQGFSLGQVASILLAYDRINE